MSIVPPGGEESTPFLYQGGMSLTRSQCRMWGQQLFQIHHKVIVATVKEKMSMTMICLLKSQYIQGMSRVSSSGEHEDKVPPHWMNAYLSCAVTREILRKRYISGRPTWKANRLVSHHNSWACEQNFRQWEGDSSTRSLNMPQVGSLPILVHQVSAGQPVSTVCTGNKQPKDK